jgi:hypothetical protein
MARQPIDPQVRDAGSPSAFYLKSIYSLPDGYSSDHLV